MKKLNLVMCFFGLLGTLTLSGCSSTSSDNGLSDEQKVTDYLELNGTGSYHYVSTGTYTKLGYMGKNFYTSYNDDDAVTKISLETVSFFNDSSIAVSIDVYYHNTLYLDATFTATTSNHYYNSSKDFKYSTNKFLSSQSSELKTIMTNACKKAIDNASSYLSSNGLPYIY